LSPIPAAAVQTKRRTVAPKLPSRGATCFDCQSNGHATKAAHLAPDARPQESATRIVTPTPAWRANSAAVRLAARAKDRRRFTQFEQAGAYFDGDHVIAAKKGMNPLDRLTQVKLMAELQEELGFPPAPKLDGIRQTRSEQGHASELHGQEIFFGKGLVRCLPCCALLHRQPNARSHGPSASSSGDDQRPE